MLSRGRRITQEKGREDNDMSELICALFGKCRDFVTECEQQLSFLPQPTSKELTVLTFLLNQYLEQVTYRRSIGKAIGYLENMVLKIWFYAP